MDGGQVSEDMERASSVPSCSCKYPNNSMLNISLPLLGTNLPTASQQTQRCPTSQSLGWTLAQ